MYFEKYWTIVVIAILIVGLDQWTKWLVRVNIPAGQNLVAWNFSNG